MKTLKAKFYITKESVDTLMGSGNWEKKELKPREASSIKKSDPFLEVSEHTDTLTTFSSGSMEEPDINNFIAGIDWIRIENNPKKSETELNTYHFTVGVFEEGKGYPVYSVWRNDKDHWTTLEKISKDYLVYI